MNTNYSLIKKAKDQVNASINLLLSQYGADQLNVDCSVMTCTDYSVYIELDSACQKLKEALDNL